MVRSARTGNAFSHPPFRVYLLANFVSSMGLWLERIGLGWLTWELTGSTFWTAFITLSSIAPAGILGPFFAVFAEHWDLRKATIILNSLSAMISTVIFLLIVTGAPGIGTLAVLSMSSGIVAAFNTPLRLVIVSAIVPASLLSSAVGLSSVGFNVSRALGPALAGLVLTTSGAATAVLINAVSFLPFIAVLALVPIRQRPRSGHPRGSVLQELIEGIRYAAGHRLIAVALIVTALNGLVVRSLIENLPAVVGGILSGETLTLTIVSAAAGAGSVLGGFFIGRSAKLAMELWQINRRMLPFGCLTVALIGFAPPMVLTTGLMMLAGFFATVIGIGSQSIIQLNVADEYRARVLSWWSTLGFGALSIGGIGISALGDFWPMGRLVTLLALAGIVASLFLRRARVE